MLAAGAVTFALMRVGWLMLTGCETAAKLLLTLTVVGADTETFVMLAGCETLTGRETVARLFTLTVAGADTLPVMLKDFVTVAG